MLEACYSQLFLRYGMSLVRLADGAHECCSEAALRLGVGEKVCCLVCCC